MSGDLSCLFFVICLVVLCSAHEELTSEVELGGSLTMNCSVHHYNDVITVMHWVIPYHLQIYSPGYEDRTYKISQNGETLAILSISSAQLGSYLCYFYNNLSHTTEYTQHNVHIQVPTFLMEYKMNLLIGGSAAAVFLTMATILCIVHGFISRGSSGIVSDEEHGNQTQDEEGYAMLQTRGKGAEGEGGVKGTREGVMVM